MVYKKKKKSYPQSTKYRTNKWTDDDEADRICATPPGRRRINAHFTQVN